MISLLLEKKRKQAQKTVLSTEYDKHSLAVVKLDKKCEKYSLVCCYSDIFPAKAYFEGELTTEYVGSVVLISSKKINYGVFCKARVYKL